MKIENDKLGSFERPLKAITDCKSDTQQSIQIAYAVADSSKPPTKRIALVGSICPLIARTTKPIAVTPYTVAKLGNPSRKLLDSCLDYLQDIRYLEHYAGRVIQATRQKKPRIFKRTARKRKW